MDGAGTVNKFPALASRGDVNKNGKTDKMDWAAMVQEEVQDQLNDAKKYDICPIDILSYYWKSSGGKLVLRITGLYGPGEGPVEASDVKIN